MIIAYEGDESADVTARGQNRDKVMNMIIDYDVDDISVTEKWKVESKPLAGSLGRRSDRKSAGRAS